MLTEITALKLLKDKKQTAVFTQDGCDQHYTPQIRLGICQDLLTNDVKKGVDSLVKKFQIIKCYLE